MLKRQNQNGRSMVEVMGYMVVGMFLIAGVAKVVTSAYGEYKLSQASMQISDFAGTIVKASAADASYTEIVNIINGKSPDGTGSTQTDLQKKERKRLIPRSYRLVGEGTSSKLYNVFGNEVKISVPSDDFSDHPGDQFAIQFMSLDRDQCITLMSKEWTNNRVVDLYAIVLNGSHYWFWPVYHPIAESNEHALPVKMADVAGTGSGTNADGLCANENNIMWVFN